MKTSSEKTTEWQRFVPGLLTSDVLSRMILVVPQGYRERMENDKAHGFEW